MVECGSAVLKALDGLSGPEPERCNVVEHLRAEGRDGVLNPGRNFSKDLARDESIALQSAERLREGLLADAFDPIHDAGEAHGLTLTEYRNHADDPDRPLL